MAPESLIQCRCGVQLRYLPCRWQSDCARNCSLVPDFEPSSPELKAGRWLNIYLFEIMKCSISVWGV